MKRLILSCLTLACAGSGTEAPPEPTLPLPDHRTVVVAGYVWDPEAVQYSFGMCGPGCSLRPVIAPGQTYFERSLVAHATVNLVEPGGASYPTETGDAGTWLISGVTRTPSPWLYAVAWQAHHADLPDAGPIDAGTTDAGNADAGPTTPFNDPVPVASTYFPTLTLTPISPHLAQCVGRPAAVIGDTGILEAVARSLTAAGTPTEPSDFVNPQKYGGVIVWWAWAVGGSTTRVGAAGVSFTASAGQLLHVGWGCPLGAVCPGGSAVPTAGLGSRSTRSFFVEPGASTSNVGLAVTLVPPNETTPITFTIRDPVIDATKSRPYQFAALPTVTPMPGKVIFAQLQALPAVVTAAAPYECAPE